jgi:hypothetical protein
MPSNPFSMDTLEHHAQNQGLIGLVHDAQGNIKRTLAVADSYRAVHQGEMAQSVNTALGDLHTTLTQNNQVLEGITEANTTTQNIVSQHDSSGQAMVAKAASSLPHGSFFGHH